MSTECLLCDGHWAWYLPRVLGPVCKLSNTLRAALLLVLSRDVGRALATKGPNTLKSASDVLMLPTVSLLISHTCPQLLWAWALMVSIQCGVLRLAAQVIKLGFRVLRSKSRDLANPKGVCLVPPKLDSLPCGQGLSSVFLEIITSCQC